MVGSAPRMADRRRARRRARPADLPRRSRSTPVPARTCSRSRRCRSASATRRSTTYERARSSTRSATSTGCPPPSRPVAAFAFGSTAHAAFEAFTKERRERAARGEPPPTREDLEREFRARWEPDRLRRPDHRGGLPAPGRDAARQLLEGRGRIARRGAARGARLRAGHRARRRRAAGGHHRLDRPHRPPALGRHRGHRLQDRQRLSSQKSVRREPPAVDLRARLPRRPRPRHARSG